ncbi:hypothetical protein [Desulfobulbus alkaliphilus]|uniref:hypothetical protein n=1 Tax=Desulfobulbus alkaliphilus TaxID=869814 RepID=UPI00196246E8|nr:hypothetical protein [Desulfobulbus alkaliphilus]MBM9537413.1 hypothetical protein [Desulfobulbus alkaliphilus]
MIDPIHCLIGGSIIVTLLFAIVLLCIRRFQAQHASTTQRIRSLREKIDTALQDECSPTPKEAFSTTLKTVQLTTGLQMPRLRNQAKLHQAPPEKYTILRRLASQGMKAEEIAAILGISHIEATQLLSLNSMARSNR